MADYIKREAVQEILKKHSIGTWRGIPCYPEEIKSAAKDVNALPAADVAPVRHGKIVETTENGKAKRVFTCCGEDFTTLTQWYMPDYCPNCGAKMDLERAYEQ